MIVVQWVGHIDTRQTSADYNFQKWSKSEHAIKNEEKRK